MFIDRGRIDFEKEFQKNCSGTPKFQGRVEPAENATSSAPAAPAAPAAPGLTMLNIRT